MKKLLRKITAALLAAGLMFPSGTLGNIDFGLTAFAEENGYTNGFCTDFADDSVCTTHTDCNGYEPAKDSDGDGVYEISNAGQLYWFADKVNGGNTGINAVLTDKIIVNSNVLKENCESNSGPFRIWTPIGWYDNANSVSYDYSGTFDGQNHTISGLYFNSSETNYVGLFGYIGENGTVKNVSVEDSYFNGKEYVGSIAGTNYGLISNVVNKGEVRGGSFVGGITGLNLGTINNNSANEGVPVIMSEELPVR